MQSRRTDNACPTGPALSFVLAIILLVGHVAAHTECGKKGKEMDTFFNLCKHLGARFKRGLEKFDSPELDHVEHKSGGNAEMLTTAKPGFRGPPQKRFVQSFVAGPAGMPAELYVQPAGGFVYPRQLVSIATYPAAPAAPEVRWVIPRVASEATVVESQPLPPPPPLLPSVETEIDLHSLDPTKMEDIYNELQQRIARAPKAEAETLKSALAGKCCLDLESCLCDPPLIAILRKMCV